MCVVLVLIYIYVWPLITVCAIKVMPKIRVTKLNLKCVSNKMKMSKLGVYPFDSLTLLLKCNEH